jgi:hypothetical protein
MLYVGKTRTCVWHRRITVGRIENTGMVWTQYIQTGCSQRRSYGTCQKVSVNEVMCT